MDQMCKGGYTCSDIIDAPCIGVNCTGDIWHTRNLPALTTRSF